ncbi:hypothetical protein MMC32_002566 [Xylographa parallela]|nr:hypothetical protein [Xylographa parallela]
MKLIPCLCFLLLSTLASTSAQRVENASYEYEQQHSGLLKARMPSSATDAAYSEYLARGRRLWATLSRELTTNSPDSPSGSAQMHRTWDFRASPTMNPPSAPMIGPLQSLHLPVGPDYTKMDALTPKGMTTPTITRYHYLFNVVNGVILVEDMFKDEARVITVADQTSIGKEHWSQVTVECWRLLCDSTARLLNHPHAPTQNLFANLRYVFMVMVTHDKTEGIINERLMVHQPSRNGPPTKFLPNSDAFIALLGSPNGQGIAYMLTQNKNAFQRKTIKSVTLQSITPKHVPEPWWHLWWEIGWETTIKAHVP